MRIALFYNAGMNFIMEEERAMYSDAIRISEYVDIEFSMLSEFSIAEIVIEKIKKGDRYKFLEKTNTKNDRNS